MADKPLDLVDINDKVIGVTDKATAHTSRQLHRCAAVFVFDQSGKLYVQVHKVSGNLLDHSVGGHVDQGETYYEAARREMKEELGIDQEIKELATSLYENPTKENGREHMFGLYECIADPKWQFVANDEVDELIPMSIEDITAMMANSPEKFTLGFIRTMQEYCRQNGIEHSINI